MDWVKKNWIVMVCGLVALAGIGIGVWAILGFQDVQTNANNIAAIASTLDGLKKGPANLKAIEDARKYYEIANRDTKAASDKAVEKNKRDPLRNDVFPASLAPDSPHNFRSAYREAMRRLPQDLKAEKAPTGNIVDRIVARMEEKAKREANVNTVGDQLHIPKTPDVPKIETVVPVAASPTDRGDDRGRGGRGEDPYRGGGRGEDPSRRGGRGEDPYRGGRGEDPYRGGGRGEDPYRGGGMPPTIGVRPGLPGALGTASAQSAVKLPTKEELMPEAKRVATYETARRIWAYIDDNSLQMHPIGNPSFVTAPDEIDMWSAQVFYWIEKDVVDALRRVNEQAAANLPEDQRWVAHLPVKHLVSLGISDYLAGSVTDVTGRSSGITLLLRNSQMSMSRTSSTAFGDSGNAFTSRARNDQYDVVHVALNLVVDARDLPKVLVELCKQNFITPLDVQYRNVDVVGAREAGYLYGTGPVIDVDIVCEMLFFRSIYESLKPEKVKQVLAGEISADPNARGGLGR